jgi:hypothetical protein
MSKFKRDDELPVYIIIDDGLDVIRHYIECDDDVQVTEDIVEQSNWRIIEYKYHDELLDEDDDDEDY